MTALAISFHPPRGGAARLPIGPMAAFAALGLFALTLVTPDVLADGDTWWHVAAGNWILDHRAVPDTDPFSFTFAGQPWTAHEWLSEILFALAYGAAGWSGVVLLTGLAAGGAALILGRRLSYDLSGPPLLAVALIGLSLAAASLLARPHILALPALAAWTAGLLAARDEGRSPPLWLLAVMAAWANLHGGFAFGLALLGPFALEAVLCAPATARVPAALRWGGFGLAALGAALLTPRGLDGLLFPLRLMGLSSLSMVGEWQPVNFAVPNAMEAALLALIGVSLRTPIRMPLLRLALLAALIHLALSHGRHQLLLGIVGPMLLARPLGEALAPAGPPSAGGPVRPGRAVALAMLAALLMAAGRLAMPVERVDGPVAPLRAVAALPDRLRSAPVLNGYPFGGYLIWCGIRPFVDGRVDLYGDEFLGEYARAISPDPAALKALLARYDIAWTIFAPSDPAVAAMDAMSGWRRLHADPTAVIHVRQGAAPGS